LILGYHRIVDDPYDPFELSVSPAHFSEHLKVLHEVARPTSLGQLVQTLSRGDVPHGAVVITLDDGYADNLYNAKPLLEATGVPATVFVISGEMGREFWWDEIAWLTEPARELPNSLQVTVGPRHFKWSRRVNATNRHTLLRSLARFLRSLSVNERSDAIAELKTQVGNSGEESAQPIHRCLSEEELAKLTEGGLVDVGAHSRSHRELAGLPLAEQRREIDTSKRTLEDATGRPVVQFSYPHGSCTHATRRLVRESGFHCACSSLRDVVQRRSDLFLLPRFWVPNVDGAQLRRILHKWLVT
jgi:peptidoglycan/xylan/chitin deacetylase (PgdA/CDA1 family)